MLSLAELRAIVTAPVSAVNAATILGVPVSRVTGWMLSNQVLTHTLPDGGIGVALDECRAMLLQHQAALAKVNGAGKVAAAVPVERKRKAQDGACWALRDPGGKAMSCEEGRAFRFPSTGLGYGGCGSSPRCGA